MNVWQFTSSVAGCLLLRLQARYRLAGAVQHLRPHLDSPRGRTGCSRSGRRASGVATGTRAQLLQSASPVIRPSATRAALRHDATAVGNVPCRKPVLNEQQSRDNRKLDKSLSSYQGDLHFGRMSDICYLL